MFLFNTYSFIVEYERLELFSTYSNKETETKHVTSVIFITNKY